MDVARAGAALMIAGLCSLLPAAAAAGSPPPATPVPTASAAPSIDPATIIGPPAPPVAPAPPAEPAPAPPPLPAPRTGVPPGADDQGTVAGLGLRGASIPLTGSEPRAVTPDLIDTRAVPAAQPAANLGAIDFGDPWRIWPLLLVTVAMAIVWIVIAVRRWNREVSETAPAR